jgi:hypothetical protein
MFELGAEEWQLISNCYGSQNNNVWSLGKRNW